METLKLMEYMKQLRQVSKQVYILGILILFCFSCNNSAQSNANQQNEIRQSTEIDLVERYVGAWKLVRMKPAIPKNDHTMDGIICQLEQYQNTKKSFLFNLFTGNKLILTAKDENNLIGENANMNIEFKDNELYLSIPKKTTWIFKKME